MYVLLKQGTCAFTRLSTACQGTSPARQKLLRMQSLGRSRPGRAVPPGQRLRAKQRVLAKETSMRAGIHENRLEVL